jgi:hypothetical protein
MDIYPIHEAFVYKWTNTETNKIYIGKHKGTTDDGYISSGKAFMSAYLANPTKFERTIIWEGTDKECLQKEWEFIKEAVEQVGWSGLYNLTHWKSSKQWTRTCLHCGKWCDANNEDWAENFEKYHFENCSQHPLNLKEKYIYKEDGIPNSKKRKMELALCSNDSEILLVNRYYEQIKLNPITDKIKRELSRIRKLLDKQLYKNQ